MDAKRIDEKIAQYERLLNEPTAPWDAPLARAERVTGVPRFRLLVAALCALAVCLQGLGPGSTAVSLVACHAYAAYATVALIVAAPGGRGRPGPGADRDADVALKWYTFWMLSAALLLLEKHLWFVVHVVPCYTLAKTVFLLWCSAPIEHNGCAYIHRHVLRPYLGPAIAAAGSIRSKAGRRSTAATAADSLNDVVADSPDDVAAAAAAAVVPVASSSGPI